MVCSDFVRIEGEDLECTTVTFTTTTGIEGGWC